MKPAKHVAFVAPFLQPQTIRYLETFARLPGCVLSVLTQDNPKKLPASLSECKVVMLKDCTQPEDLVRAVRQVGAVDRLLSPLEQLQVPVAEAREALQIPGLHRQAAVNFRDKDQMKAVLRQAGLPVAASQLATSAQQIRQFGAEHGYPIIVKPPDGLGAKATYRINAESELASVVRQLNPSPEQPIQVEEFITGQERTFETISIQGTPVWWSGTRYFPGPLTVLENPWMQYCVLLPRESDAHFESFKTINFRALQALGQQTGLSHMEWFLREDGRAVISEVGARPPGVQIMPLMSTVFEVDMIAAWAKLMVHDQFEPRARKWAAGVAFFRGSGPGSRVVRVDGLDKAQARAGEWVVDRSLPAVGMLRGSGYEGEGWAIVRHPTTEGAMAALKALVEDVRVIYG